MSSWNGQQSPPGGSEGGESGGDSEGAGSGTASSAGSRVHHRPPHAPHSHASHHSQPHPEHHSHHPHHHHHHRSATHRAHRCVRPPQPLLFLLLAAVPYVALLESQAPASRGPWAGRQNIGQLPDTLVRRLLSACCADRRGPKNHHFHLASSATGGHGGNSSDPGPGEQGAAAGPPSGRETPSSGDGSAAIAHQLEHMALTDDKESDNYDEHDPHPRLPKARRAPPSIFPPNRSMSGNLGGVGGKPVPGTAPQHSHSQSHLPSAKSGSYQSLVSMTGSDASRGPSPTSYRLTPAHRSRSRSLDSIRSQLSPPPPPEKSLFPNGMIFGIDIGGTLGKIVFREPSHIPAGPQAEQVKRLREHFLRSSSYDADKEEDDGLIVACPVFAGTLRFISFPTTRIDVIFEIIRNERSFSPNEVSNWKVFATGGGAFKYEKRFWDELGVHVRKSDEMETLVSGVQCLIESVADECFTWCPAESLTSKGQARRPGPGVLKRHLENTDDFIKKTIMLEKAAKPWMVVNVGSGVSMLKIDEQMTVRFGKVGTYKRVGGTPLGGGTFLALGCLLTGANSHAELLELAQKGNSKNVDKLVGDIYGDDYVGLGLSADTVASSFGNLVNPEVRNKVKREDLAAALIQMISWNIAQLARLVAQQEGVKTIVFTGSFMHKNELAQKKLASSIRYWSNNDSVALFMRHEGYVGAVGALAMSNVPKKAQENAK